MDRIKILFDVLKSKEGIFSVFMIVAGLVAMILFQKQDGGSTKTIICSLVSIWGTQNLTKILAEKINEYNREHQDR